MITKILSVATLLAATTAIANAATVLTLDSATLKSNAGTYTVSGQTIGSGYGNFSVSIVFDIDALNTKMKATFNTGDASNIIRTEDSQTETGSIGVKYDGYGAQNTSGLFGSWKSSLTAYALTEDSGNGSNYIGATNTSGQGLNSFFTSNTVTAAALTYTLSSSGISVYLTLKTSECENSTTTTTTLIGTNSSLKNYVFGSISKIVYDSSLVTYLTVDNTVLGTEDAKKQNEANIIASIPEPSAFGLLAGLGAIALAVSRRRRSR